MNLLRELVIIGVHAEGEIGRVVVSGVPEIPGETFIKKMNHINNENDEILG